MVGGRRGSAVQPRQQRRRRRDRVRLLAAGGNAHRHRAVRPDPPSAGPGRYRRHRSRARSSPRARRKSATATKRRNRRRPAVRWRCSRGPGVRPRSHRAGTGRGFGALRLVHQHGAAPALRPRAIAARRGIARQGRQPRRAPAGLSQEVARWPRRVHPHGSVPKSAPPRRVRPMCAWRASAPQFEMQRERIGGKRSAAFSGHSIRAAAVVSASSNPSSSSSVRDLHSVEIVMAHRQSRRHSVWTSVKVGLGTVPVTPSARRSARASVVLPRPDRPPAPPHRRAASLRQSARPARRLPPGPAARVRAMPDISHSCLF